MHARWFAGAALLSILPLMHGACGQGETIEVQGINVPCEDDCDCYTGQNYFLGTGCYNGVCQCPPQFTEMYMFPCCEKGRPKYDCRRQCRAIEECDPEEIDPKYLPPGTIWPPVEGSGGAGGEAGGTGSASSSSSSSSGNAVEPECAKAEDCPMPEDARCADAVCEGGKCGFVFKAVQKVESQIKGDCVSQYCDGQGKVMAVEDPSDVYNDGKQCTFDVCTQGIPEGMNFPDGFTCPETGIGVCFDGECVDCVQNLTWCNNGLACLESQCVPMHCVNNQIDPNLGETDKDCGGPCRDCVPFEFCKVASDCVHGVCNGALCQAPTCSDGVKNDSETGIDCGGLPSCPRCPGGQGCALPSDCLSGVCWAGVCEGP